MDSVKRWRDDRIQFFTDCLTHPDGRSYGAHLDPFQLEDFTALDSACNHWWERPRGHSKTMDLAAAGLHHILTTPSARAYLAAADRDQAGLGFDSLVGFVRRSPPLTQAFRIKAWEIVAPSTDARLTVLPADAPGSWGLRPSWVGVDEFSIWRGAGAEEFFYALYSALGKVPDARMIVASTAGWDEQSLAYEFRQRVVDDPAWHFSRRGQCASWVSPEFLAEQKRLLPDAEYRRVHENLWTEPTGQLVTGDDWASCEKRLTPLAEGDRTPLVVGVDAGWKHDAFGVVAVSRDPEQRDEAVAVRMVKSWEPMRGSEVAFTGEGSPDEYIRQLAQDFNVVTVVYDPYQLAAVGQAWSRDGVSWAQEFQQGQPRLLADSALYHAIKMRRVRHCGEPELRRHVLNAGFRMAAAGEGGLRLTKQHPKRRIDLAVALSMAHSECKRLVL